MINIGHSKNTIHLVKLKRLHTTSPQKVAEEGKSRLVKYFNLARKKFENQQQIIGRFMQLLFWPHNLGINSHSNNSMENLGP